MLRDVKCPTCHKPTPWQGNPNRPFCSERCRVQDLGNWASGRYRLPGPPVDPQPVEPGEDDEDS